jgi:hypothetical protein
VLIYGAGRKGAAALRELLFDREAPLRPVGIIDDDPVKTGRLLNGIPIIGSMNILELSIRRFAARAVILASDKIPADRLTRIHELCDGLGVGLLRMQVTFDQCAPAPAQASVQSWQRSPSLPLPSLRVTLSQALGASGLVGQRCRKCGSFGLHRSHARTVIEQVRKFFTERRLYRCEVCGWRGWTDTLQAAVPEPARNAQDLFPSFESVDAVLQ